MDCYVCLSCVKTTLDAGVGTRANGTTGRARGGSRHLLERSALTRAAFTLLGVANSETWQNGGEYSKGIVDVERVCLRLRANRDEKTAA